MLFQAFCSIPENTPLLSLAPECRKLTFAPSSIKPSPQRVLWSIKCTHCGSMGNLSQLRQYYWLPITKVRVSVSFCNTVCVYDLNSTFSDIGINMDKCKKQIYEKFAPVHVHINVTESSVKPRNAQSTIETKTCIRKKGQIWQMFQKTGVSFLVSSIWIG